MHVAVRKSADVVIVDLDGKLTMGLGDQILREAIDELLAEGWKKIVLNLSKVSFMDSAGVGELVASWKLAAEFGASMKLLRPGDRVRYTLHLSQILPLLEVFEDEATAVRSFTS
jgi:anti-sigma B factor antagonist